MPMAKTLATGFATGRNVLNGREAIGESDKIMFWENTPFFVSKKTKYTKLTKVK